MSSTNFNTSAFTLEQLCQHLLRNRDLDELRSIIATLDEDRLPPFLNVVACAHRLARRATSANARQYIRPLEFIQHELVSNKHEREKAQREAELRKLLGEAI